jgi:hypothetical protein
MVPVVASIWLSRLSRLPVLIFCLLVRSQASETGRHRQPNLQWRHHRHCRSHANPPYRFGLYPTGKRYLIGFNRTGGFDHQRLLGIQLLTGDKIGFHQLLIASEIAACVSTVTVRSRVDGQLLSIHFQEGQQVKAGELLIASEIAACVSEGGVIFGKLPLRLGQRDLELAGMPVRSCSWTGPASPRRLTAAWA